MKEKITPSPRSGQVQSLTRAISLLRILSESATGATLKELSAEAKLAPSTAHRLLTTLQGERFVRFEPLTNIWQVGVGAFGVGSAFLRTRDVSITARPYLHRIAEMTGEATSLYVAAEDRVVCMVQVAGRDASDVIAQVGDRLPMHTSAAGKAILSRLSPDIVEQLIRDRGLERRTANTRDSRLALLGALERAREIGYSTDLEENTEGVTCVGAALLDETGYPTAAISISGATARIGAEQVRHLGNTVRETAERIMTEMGGAFQAAQ